MTGISGKVVAITGASSGIGEATARLLAERGAAVVLGGRRTERLDKRAQEIRDQGHRAISRATDVPRREDVQRLADRAVAEFGRLDVLVSNAGISKIGPMADLDLEGWSAMIDVNLRGDQERRPPPAGRTAARIDRRRAADNSDIAGLRPHRTRRLHRQPRSPGT